ncbi:MAG: hypothetical protein HC796_04500 [Synechococcaceae cyanobacterium RL_1_2]|nr:hypothetical protein [Synechococcaceae cyanobacterium RL_1_2]
MQNNLKIPINLRNKINKELQPAEVIIWVQQPIPRFFTGASIISFLFGIPWTSFALFWTWGALGFALPDLKQGPQPQHMFALFGIPFVLIGVAMLFSPILLWQLAQHTVYLVTDQRAISIQDAWVTTIRSYLPHQLQNIYRKERADGTGDVIITVRQWKDSDGNPIDEEIGFFGVPNPQDVENILRQLSQKNV